MKTREMIDVPIGGIIERFGKQYKCVKPVDLPIATCCASCAFIKMPKVCDTVKCTRSRDDKQFVIFKEVK